MTTEATKPVPTKDDSGTQLRSGALGVPALLFLVMAFMAPVTSTAGNVPFIVGLGNGLGGPAMFVVAGILLTLFTVPYAAMSRRITNAGAFYAYVSAGFGREAGVATGWVAQFTYNIIMLIPVAYAGFFGSSVFLTELGVDVPWPVFSLGVIVLVWILGIRGIDFNTFVIGIMLALEFVILTAMIIGVTFKHGLNPETFSPSTVFSGDFGVAFMFALLSFGGFEATALFGEETKNPKTTVARATYLAVWSIVVIFTFTGWAAVSLYSADEVGEFALANAGSFIYGAVVYSLGSTGGSVFNWVLLMSIVACCMSIHNMAARYLYAFGRDGLLPRSLARTHPRFRTPWVASTLQAAVMVVFVVGVFVAGSDPYTALAGVSGAFATIGLMVLMLGTIAAAMRFLHGTDESLWTRVLAPTLAFIGLGAGLVLVIMNVGILAASDSLGTIVIFAIPVVLVLGYAHGVYAKRHGIEMVALDQDADAIDVAN